MKTLESRLVLDLNHKPGNPRNSEGSFIRADDGTILFAYSQYYGTNGDDHQPSNIALVRSKDEGETWSDCQIIEQDKNNGKGFCYPAMFFTNDGCILIAYCRGGTEDGFCLFRTGIRKIRLQDIE